MNKVFRKLLDPIKQFKHTSILLVFNHKEICKCFALQVTIELPEDEHDSSPLSLTNAASQPSKVHVRANTF